MRYVKTDELFYYKASMVMVVCMNLVFLTEVSIFGFIVN